MNKILFKAELGQYEQPLSRPISSAKPTYNSGYSPFSILTPPIKTNIVQQSSASAYLRLHIHIQRRQPTRQAYSENPKIVNKFDIGQLDYTLMNTKLLFKVKRRIMVDLAQARPRLYISLNLLQGLNKVIAFCDVVLFFSSTVNQNPCGSSQQHILLA